MLVVTPVLDYALGKRNPTFLLKSMSWLLGHSVFSEEWTVKRWVHVSVNLRVDGGWLLMEGDCTWWVNGV